MKTFQEYFEFLCAAIVDPSNTTFKEIKGILEQKGLSESEISKFYTFVKPYRQGRGAYNLNAKSAQAPVQQQPEKINMATADTIIPKNLENSRAINNKGLFVPKKDPVYIKNDTYTVLEKIVKSDIFCPTMLVGPSGCSKSQTVEQVHAAAGTELIVVNVSNDMDESDLIGSLVLQTTTTYEVELSDDDYQAALKMLACL